MSDKKLSKNEKIVLYGLVKYPLLNDRELAEKLKLNISTLTAIKNRLKKREYYRTVRIPMLQNLGCELLGFGMFKLNLAISAENRAKMEKDFSGKFPEVVVMISESDYLICVLMAQNFTEMRAVFDDINGILEKYDAIGDKAASTFIFPFQTTRVFNYFEYAPLLGRAFGIKDDKRKEPKPPKQNLEPKKLSRIEKIVFHGLVKYPDLPDKKIAEYTNVTRQVVARLRKDFESEELIKTVKIPYLKKLGFQILAFSYAQINIDAIQEVRKKGAVKVFQDIPTIFWASGNYESVIVSAMQNFDDYKDLYTTGFGHLQKYNFFKELPVPQSISINRLNLIKFHDYAPIVNKIFELSDTE